MKEITIYGNKGAKTFRENQMIDLCGCWMDVVSVGIVDGKKQIVLEVSTIDEEHCKEELIKKGLLAPEEKNPSDTLSELTNKFLNKPPENKG